MAKGNYLKKATVAEKTADNLVKNKTKTKYDDTHVTNPPASAKTEDDLADDTADDQSGGRSNTTLATSPQPLGSSRQSSAPGRNSNEPKRIISRVGNKELGAIVGWGRKEEGAEKAVSELSPGKVQAMIKAAGMTRVEITIARDFYQKHADGEERGMGVAVLRAKLMQKILRHVAQVNLREDRMTRSIKRKILIENLSAREISVIIEPLGDERNLIPNEKLFIDLTMWEDLDIRDKISIDYHDNGITLYQEEDIDMEFCDKADKG